MQPYETLHSWQTESKVINFKDSLSWTLSLETDIWYSAAGVPSTSKLPRPIGGLGRSHAMAKRSVLLPLRSFVSFDGIHWLGTTCYEKTNECRAY